MNDTLGQLEQLIAQADLPREQHDRLAALLVHAEQETADLRAGKAEIESVLQTTVDGVITIDQEGTVHSFNPAAERIFGFSATDVVGRNVALLMPAPFNEQHKGYLDHYLATGEARVIGIGREIAGQRKDGKTVPLELSVSEVRLRDRVLFTGIVRDITERKKVDEALAEERHFLHAMVDTIEALVVVLDCEGRVVRFNGACEKATGTTLAEVAGKPFWDLCLTSEDREKTEKTFLRLREGKQVANMESGLRTRGGRARQVAWTPAVLRDRDGTIASVIETGIDVTEHRRAEEAIVSVSETERRIVGRELHDALGQQLTGLSLLTKSLEKQMGACCPGLLPEVERIRELSRTALTETKRLAQGLYPTGIERHGLSAALMEFADTQRLLYRIDCRYEGDPDADFENEAIPLHLFRIAQEAVNNAVKHSECSNISIDLRQDGEQTALRVTDNGVGIPSNVEELEGMGLLIMKYRAELIGADFGLRRRQRGGTEVRCTLPAPGARGPREEVP